MKINLITAVPEYFAQLLQVSMLGRAQAHGAVEFAVVSLRDFADGRRKKQVDDCPYGGGPGMILKVEPIARALDYLAARGERGQVWLTSARGQQFDQAVATAWASEPVLTLICGHYEGVDERVVSLADGQICLGPFVLTGGEPAAAAMLDATVRLLPGVLGNSESLCQESFTDGVLEYPQYTRPAEYAGMRVPEVLLSGNHGEIARWRAAMSQQLSTS